MPSPPARRGVLDDDADHRRLPTAPRPSRRAAARSVHRRHRARRRRRARRLDPGSSVGSRRRAGRARGGVRRASGASGQRQRRPRHGRDHRHRRRVRRCRPRVAPVARPDGVGRRGAGLAAGRGGRRAGRPRRGRVGVPVAAPGYAARPRSVLATRTGDRRRLSTPGLRRPRPTSTSACSASGLDRLFDGDAPDHQRLAAATTVLPRSFSVIAGGPGTGKTTTVAAVLALAARAGAATGQPIRIALAAPTGKAAARLTEAVHAGAARLDVDDDIRDAILATEASTIHRLLGRAPGVEQPLPSRSRQPAAPPRGDRRRDLDGLAVDDGSPARGGPSDCPARAGRRPAATGLRRGRRGARRHRRTRGRGLPHDRAGRGCARRHRWSVRPRRAGAGRAVDRRRGRGAAHGPSVHRWDRRVGAGDRGR